MKTCKIVCALFFGGILLTHSSAEAQNTSPVQQAESFHEQGIQLFQSGRYREAALKFEEAERLSHSRANWRNLARCYQELGDFARALDYINRYLGDSDLTADARDRAELLRQELLAASQGASTNLPTNQQAAQPVAPHNQQAVQPLEISDEPAEAGLSPQQASRPSLAGPWVLLSTGLAVLVTGGILDILAYSRTDTERDEDDPFTKQADYEDWRDSATNYAIAGDVLVGVGGAVTVAGLIWLLVARARRSSSQALEVPLTVTAGANGISLASYITF